MPQPAIRILLVDLPCSACELIAEIVEHDADLEIVGETEPGDDIGATAALLGAEIVIVGLEDGELPPSVHELFARRARLKVLAVPDGVTTAHLHELQPVRAGVCEVAGPGDFGSAIRFAVGRA